MVRQQAQQRMYVIGISSGIKHGHHDGAAVLLRDGKLIAAAKKSALRWQSMRAENCRAARSASAEAGRHHHEGCRLHLLAVRTYTNYERRLTEYFTYQFGHSRRSNSTIITSATPRAAFYGSGFSEATVACFDFSGDSSSGLVAHVRGNDFKVLTRFGRHNSLGLYYGMLTQYLGYQMTNDEYKVMGLSSYGSPKYLDRFATLLRPNGIDYELDDAWTSAAATPRFSPAISRRGRNGSLPRSSRTSSGLAAFAGSRSTSALPISPPAARSSSRSSPPRWFVPPSRRPAAPMSALPAASR